MPKVKIYFENLPKKFKDNILKWPNYPFSTSRPPKIVHQWRTRVEDSVSSSFGTHWLLPRGSDRVRIMSLPKDFFFFFFNAKRIVSWTLFLTIVELSQSYKWYKDVCYMEFWEFVFFFSGKKRNYVRDGLECKWSYGLEEACETHKCFNCCS